MTFSLLNSIFQCVASRWPLLLYAATWTAILTMTVAVASLAPEIAFVSAISPTSAFSKACETEGPTEVLCVPAHLFRRSKVDLLVPPFLAAVIVAGSASVVRSLGLWEDDDEAQ